LASNLQVLLDHRPTDKVSPANFRFLETPVPAPGPGEVLVRHSFLSLDPYMRGRLNDAKSYAKPQEIGAVMGGVRSESSRLRTILAFIQATPWSAWAAGNVIR
jgi:NADPH-dependent curcumin reductase CurA